MVCMVVVKLGTSEAVSAAESLPPRSCHMVRGTGRDEGDDAAIAAAQQQTIAATLCAAARIFKWTKMLFAGDAAPEIVPKLEF